LRVPWTGMNPMQVEGDVGFQNRRLKIPKESRSLGWKDHLGMLAEVGKICSYHIRLISLEFPLQFT